MKHNLVLIICFIISLLANIIIILLVLKKQKTIKKLKEKLNIKTDKLNRESEKLNKLKNFSDGTITTQYKYQDIVLLGARNSGKTSLGKLWNKPWFDIYSTKSTKSWVVYESPDLVDLGSKRKFDENLGINRKYRDMFRLRIHDYPGEDSYRDRAISDLTNLDKAVLILIFDLEVSEQEELLEDYNKNNNYYSQIFMDCVENQTNLTSSISQVFIVFNKIDLISNKLKNEQLINNYLEGINYDALRRIKSLFDEKIKIYSISLETNTNVIKLLGDCCKTVINSEEKLIEMFDMINQLQNGSY